MNIDQTLTVCRQLVKNYKKLAHDKHILYEKLKHSQNEQTHHEKREDTSKHDLGRLQTTQERLSDDVQRSLVKIQHLTQIIQTKDKEV